MRSNLRTATAMAATLSLVMPMVPLSASAQITLDDGTVIGGVGQATEYCTAQGGDVEACLDDLAQRAGFADADTAREVLAPDAGAVTEEVIVEEVVEAPVVEEPVVEEPVVEESVVEAPVVEEPAVEEPQVAEPVVEEPAVEAPVVEEPEVAEPVVEEPAVEEPVIAEPVPETPAPEAPVAEAPAEVPADDPVAEAPVETAPEAPVIVEAPTAEEEAPLLTEDATDDPVAVENPDVADAVEPVDEVVNEVPESAIADEIAARPEPELTEEEELAREQAEAALSALDDGTTGTAAATAADDDEGGTVEETVVAEEDVRTSDEDFTTSVVETERRDDSGLSRGQKLALGALGALAVGAVLNNRSRVVSNSGDRVVVQRDDGNLQVLKDDDALLRQAGSNVQTRTFDDGSTRTIVTRDDGSQIITVRDASLRVLRRVLVQPNGEEFTLIDDTAEVEPVDVTTLPPAIVSSRAGLGDDPLRAALQREAGLDRRFSLAQVRNISEVRQLAPAFEVETVTFASGSAAIEPEQARNLTELAREVLAAIRANPREVFLIEGHTDAVGDAAYNLALSDRRAETLALALNEYFQIPVENMVVQGYGEQFLKIPVLTDERANRRATVRQITGLLQTAAAN